MVTQKIFQAFKLHGCKVHSSQLLLPQVFPFYADIQIARIIKFLFVIFLAGSTAISCSRGPEVKMRGKYINENQQANLEITSEKMVVSSGPLTIGADYKVLNVNGTDVTVELSAPNTPKATMVVTVNENYLEIDNFLFGGTWTRK